MSKSVSLSKGLLALIAVHLLGLLLVLGVVLGMGWLLAWLLGLVWFETAVLTLACLGWAVVFHKIFKADFVGSSVLFVLITLVTFGGGWLLARWSPFTVFQAGGLLWGSMLVLFYYLYSQWQEIQEELMGGSWDDDEVAEMPIPLSRFANEAHGETGEAIFRYVIANAIYLRMEATPAVRGSLDDTEAQELSIRLTDAAISILKRKPRRTKRFQITVSGLREAFSKMGQQPYAPDILELAVVAVNTQILLDEDLDEIIRDRLWSVLYME